MCFLSTLINYKNKNSIWNINLDLLDLSHITFKFLKYLLIISILQKKKKEKNNSLKIKIVISYNLTKLFSIV